MFFKGGFTSAISKANKAVLFLFLLMQTVAVQALEPTETAAGSDTEPATEAVATADGERQRKFDFPRWPEHKRLDRGVPREVIPPAPPGPYMSSALSKFSVAGPAFARNANKPAIRMKPSEMPMEAFSPDIPWPGNHDAPQRWVPESGYNFFEPVVNERNYPVMTFRGPQPGPQTGMQFAPQRVVQQRSQQPSNYSAAYGRRPNMNRPAPGMSSRSAPPAMRPPSGMSQRSQNHRNAAAYNPAQQMPAQQMRRPAYLAPAPSSPPSSARP